jgi:LysR family glycine cleavage system transcriptional activator
MTRSLPSLTALRVFEVAGRLESFSKAALELNITQGAVSRQIRSLEDDLQQRMFVRLTRKVELTNSGQKYLAEVSSAFRIIEQSTARVRTRQTKEVLTISVLPSVGSFWLMPRLAHFSQRHPNIETRIITGISSVNLHTREADVAIRVGGLPGRRYDPHAPRVDLTMVVDWRGVLAEELSPDILVPVYSPDLGDMGAALADPVLFRDLPLIHTTSRANAWPDWMRAHSMPPSASTRKLEYGHFFMSLEAAREGTGLAIVPELLLGGAVSKGLVAAHAFKVRSAAEYYMLTLNERSGEHSIEAFRAWMREEMAKTVGGK